MFKLKYDQNSKKMISLNISFCLPCNVDVRLLFYFNFEVFVSV